MPLVSGVSVCACSRMLPATLTAIFTTYIAVVNMGADTAVTHVQPHQTVVPNAHGICTAHLNTISLPICALYLRHNNRKMKARQDWATNTTDATTTFIT